jgi:hypothetical protein
LQDGGKLAGIKLVQQFNGVLRFGKVFEGSLAVSGLQRGEAAMSRFARAVRRSQSLLWQCPSKTNHGALSSNGGQPVSSSYGSPLSRKNTRRFQARAGKRRFGLVHFAHLGHFSFCASWTFNRNPVRTPKL